MPAFWPPSLNTTTPGHGRGTLFVDQLSQRLAQAAFRCPAAAAPLAVRRCRGSSAALAVASLGESAAARLVSRGLCRVSENEATRLTSPSKRLETTSCVWRAACRPGGLRPTRETTCSTGWAWPARPRPWHRASPCSSWYRPAPARASCVRPWCSVRFSRCKKNTSNPAKRRRRAAPTAARPRRGAARRVSRRTIQPASPTIARHGNAQDQILPALAERLQPAQLVRGAGSRFGQQVSGVINGASRPPWPAGW